MILGADGYLGWPMSIELALDKHKLLMVDNYLKRSLIKKSNMRGIIFVIPVAKIDLFS